MPNAQPFIPLGRTFEDQEVGWRPTGEKNPHIAIIGQSGTGKTQTVKSVIREGQKLGISFLILDYHDEYTDLASRTIDVRKGLSINPLEVPGTSEVDTSYLVASVFRRLGLVGGDQQEAFFRKAIFLSYGIDPDRSMKPLPSLVPKAAPTFADVRRSLSRIEASDSAARRVVPALKKPAGYYFRPGALPATDGNPLRRPHHGDYCCFSEESPDGRNSIGRVRLLPAEALGFRLPLGPVSGVAPLLRSGRSAPPRIQQVSRRHNHPGSKVGYRSSTRKPEPARL